MIKKIIFIFSKFFEQKDWEIFDCDYYMEKRIEIEIWSLVKIHYQGKAKTPKYLFRDYNVKYFDELSDFKNNIRRQDCKSVIFIIYPSLGENSRTGYIIRYFIKKSNCRYCDYFYPPVVNNLQYDFDGISSIIRYYYENIRKKDVLKQLLFSIIFPPKFIFINAYANRNMIANKYDLLNRDRLIYINTPDYDKFLIQNEDRDLDVIRRENLMQNGYIVFLDEAHTHHSDTVNEGLSTGVTEDVYGKEIRYLFDIIESKTNMEVVIALHPKAEYIDSCMFGGRKMIHGESRVLIKYSNFVILDYSTAVSYIMLYRKKVFLYTTNQLRKNMGGTLPPMQRWFAELLGCRILNISNNIPENLMEKYLFCVKDAIRREYIKKYVCSRKNKEKKISSHIIYDCIKRL